jgi:transcriptional antiterminator NusG
MTGHENKAMGYLCEKMRDHKCTPFIPKHEYIHHASGKRTKRTAVLFPGYVFIESDYSDCEFYYIASKAIKRTKDIICLLKYGNENLFSIRECEKQAMCKLLNGNRCIEISEGIIVGDHIVIKSGPLCGMESTVQKIDRHKQKAWIIVELFGEARSVSVGLEIVEKKFATTKESMEIST